MYIFKLKLSEKARGYCMYVFLVKDLNKLLYSQNRYKVRIFYCRYCFHGFIREDLLEDHEPHCAQHGPQHIQLPGEESSSLFFKDYHKQLKVPFVIYADFESLTTKIGPAEPNPNKSFTEKKQHIFEPFASIFLKFSINRMSLKC